MAQRTSLVFVTVGTDHHPFNRIVRWTDSWLGSAPSDTSCFMQTGTSVAPRLAEHRAYVSVEEMEDLITRADAVICHGGPGTIAACWHGGRRPIVIPRRHALGEHVDDHQLMFARRLAASGVIFLPEDEASFRSLVTTVREDPSVARMRRADKSPAELASRRFAELVDPLLLQPRRRRRGVTRMPTATP